MKLIFEIDVEEDIIVESLIYNTTKEFITKGLEKELKYSDFFYEEKLKMTYILEDKVINLNGKEVSRQCSFSIVKC